MNYIVKSGNTTLRLECEEGATINIKVKKNQQVSIELEEEEEEDVKNIYITKEQFNIINSKLSEILQEVVRIECSIIRPKPKPKAPEVKFEEDDYDDDEEDEDEEEDDYIPTKRREREIEEAFKGIIN